MAIMVVLPQQAAAANAAATATRDPYKWTVL